MKKIIGIIDNKEKKLSSYVLSQVFKKADYVVKTISACDKDIENVTDFEDGTDIILLEIDLEDLGKLSKSHIDIDILIDLDIGSNQNKENLIHRLKKDSLLVVNADDGESIKLASVSDKPIVMTYGLNGKSSITFSSLTFDDKTNFNLCLQRRIKTIYDTEIPQFEYPLEMSLINMDKLCSVIALISACIYLGVDIKIIADTLREIKV